MINYILLVLHLLVSMVLLKCTNSPPVIRFLNFVRLFHLWVLLIIILPVSFVIFFHLQFLMITLAKILFLLFFQIKNANLSKKILVSYDVTSLFTNIQLQETIDIAIKLIFNHNPNLSISRKELKKTFSLHHRLILFITVSFTIKWMEQPQVPLQLLALLTSLWVFTNLSGLMNIILTNLNFILDMLMTYQ